MINLIGLSLIIASVFFMIAHTFGANASKILHALTESPLNFLENYILNIIINLLCGIGLMLRKNTARIIAIMIGFYAITSGINLFIPIPIPETLKNNPAIRELASKESIAAIHRTATMLLVFGIISIGVMLSPATRQKFLADGNPPKISPGKIFIIILAFAIIFGCTGQIIVRRIKVSGTPPMAAQTNFATPETTNTSPHQQNNSEDCKINGIMRSNNIYHVMIGKHAYSVGDNACGGIITNISVKTMSVKSKTGTKVYSTE